MSSIPYKKDTILLKTFRDISSQFPGTNIEKSHLEIRDTNRCPYQLDPSLSLEVLLSLSQFWMIRSKKRSCLCLSAKDSKRPPYRRVIHITKEKMRSSTQSRAHIGHKDKAKLVGRKSWPINGDAK